MSKRFKISLENDNSNNEDHDLNDIVSILEDHDLLHSSKDLHLTINLDVANLTKMEIDLLY